MTLFEEYAKAANGLIYVATEQAGQPSLRIMGFGIDPKQPNHWYLVSQPDTKKMADLKQNDKVAIMTVMNMAEGGKRVESNNATMAPSEKTWADVKDCFTNPVFHKNHPHPEEEVLLELTIHSARLAAFAGDETVSFDD